MASLTSPGVAVSVIDESFYVPADAGTTPLFIVTSDQDKTAGSGTTFGSNPAIIKINHPDHGMNDDKPDKAFLISAL